MSNLLTLQDLGLIEALLVLGLIVWEIFEPNPGPHAQFLYVFMLAVLMLLIVHALYNIVLHRRNLRANISRLSVAIAGIVFFLIPYQEPTAHPLFIAIRSEIRGTNPVIHAAFLHDYPDEDFSSAGLPPDKEVCGFGKLATQMKRREPLGVHRSPTKYMGNHNRRPHFQLTSRERGLTD